MDAKTKAIVAHITYIGWIIALVININEKDELSSNTSGNCWGFICSALW